MNDKNINNLVELFFYNYNKQEKNNIFLTSLKEPNNKYTWEKTFHSL